MLTARASRSWATWRPGQSSLVYLPTCRRTVHKDKITTLGPDVSQAKTSNTGDGCLGSMQRVNEAVRDGLSLGPLQQGRGADLCGVPTATED